MAPKQNSLLRETSVLREVMSSPGYRIRYTSHALEEMGNDNIINADIIAVLEKGKVTWIENKKDVLWHVEGKDCDSRRVRLVISVNNDVVIVKIITAMLL